MTPAQAAAILVVPSLVTNIWQFVAGGELLALVRRMWPMLAGIALGTWIGAVLLPLGNSTAPIQVPKAMPASIGHIRRTSASSSPPATNCQILVTSDGTTKIAAACAGVISRPVSYT